MNLCQDHGFAPNVVFELDQDGNEVSVTHDTIENVFDYVEANLTCIEVDELTIPAFRLNV